MKRKQLISHDDSVLVPEGTVLRKPCSDCPWSRGSLKGWTGSLAPQGWIEAAHGEAIIDCHMFNGAQCAGVAIYRANVCKMPRSSNTLRLPANRVSVFAGPTEFLNHHKDKP